MTRPGEPPVPLAAFVGRRREVADVGRLLDATRLLTLTGAGGSGKTRLAIEVVPLVRAPCSWVELAGVADLASVPQHVAEALGIREPGSRGVVEALAELLRDGERLLVLDNCEHVVDAAARLVDQLLRACPHLQVLATSREPLGLAGERAWLVPALSLPARDATVVSEPDAYDAIRLFGERARDVQPGFTVDASNAGTVAEICRRLDGLPLAIELAAARIRVLPLEQILSRLHDSFRLLTSGSRTAIPRHQTLRATMDWSYALLTAEEQQLLERLSVFSGGFTLDAAETTCGGDLDVLARLVDRSLVTMREIDGAARYSLLELVRQYAAERLHVRGESRALRQRHAEQVAALLATAEPHWIRTTRPAWLARVYAELDNVRSALAWTHEHAHELHLEMTGRLCWFWFATGQWTEARTWSEGALALPVAAAPTRGRAATLFSAAVIACMQGQPAIAQRWLDETVAIARACGDVQLEAYALNYLGMAQVQQGQAAEVTIGAARDWFRANHDLYGLRLSLLLLASMHLARGATARAMPFLEEAVEVARAFGLPRELGIALQMLGSTVLQQGDLEQASSLLHDSLAALRQDPQYFFLARGLDMIGLLLSRRGGTVEAARLLGAGESVRRMIGASTFQNEHRTVTPWIAELRVSLGDAAFDQAFAAGRATSTDEAIARALSHARPRTTTSAAVVPRAEGFGLRVRGLGPLEITCGETRLARDAWTSARARELLLFLLLHPNGKRREEIGLVFWPDASAAQVKNSFHVLLHRLRKALGRTDIVVVEDERYQINPALDTWFDAAVVEREARAAKRDATRLEAVISLYRGDLFDGEVTADWHFERQDRLRTVFRDALSTLADVRLEQAELVAATSVLERLVSDDPLREDAHRRLVLCYARSGQRDRALQQYERLVDGLRDELGAVPSRATVELADKIRRAEAV